VIPFANDLTVRPDHQAILLLEGDKIVWARRADETLPICGFLTEATAAEVRRVAAEIVQERKDG
jgi:hypothetical protein